MLFQYFPCAKFLKKKKRNVKIVLLNLLKFKRDYYFPEVIPEQKENTSKSKVILLPSSRLPKRHFIFIACARMKCLSICICICKGYSRFNTTMTEHFSEENLSKRVFLKGKPSAFTAAHWKFSFIILHGPVQCRCLWPFAVSEEKSA